jgi:hypothetical protein
LEVPDSVLLPVPSAVAVAVAVAVVKPVSAVVEASPLESSPHAASGKQTRPRAIPEKYLERKLIERPYK